jgi:hypothetical protein
VSNRLYVQVGGDEKECTVAVTRLRAWHQTLEVPTRTRRWIEAHLRGFMTGVSTELATGW